MVAAFLKLYMIGTVLTIFAVLYSIVDSLGGLMYDPRGPHTYRLQEAEHQTHWPRNGRRESAVTRGMGS